MERLSELTRRDFEVPAIEADEALVRVEMAGVCFTDPKLLHGAHETPELPLIPGHEILGVIEEIGPVGDRVDLEASVS